MTTLIEAARQALEALELTSRDYREQRHAVSVLRQAIEQAEKPEPVATMWQHGETGRTRITTPDSITDCDARWLKVSDLYTSPPNSQWIDLTPEEVVNVANAELSPKSFARGAAWANAKLKEKNT